MEAKVREEAEKRRIAKEEEKKKTLEYIQQLWNEVIAEDAALLEGAEGFQVAGSKWKEVASRNEEGQWPFKKARGKQTGKDHGAATVKIEGANPCKRCVSTG